MEVIINFKELEDYINQNINAVSHLAGLGINSEAVETRYITLKEVLDKANELKRFVPTSESSDSEKLKSIQKELNTSINLTTVLLDGKENNRETSKGNEVKICFSKEMAKRIIKTDNLLRNDIKGLRWYKGVDKRDSYLVLRFFYHINYINQDFKIQNLLHFLLQAPRVLAEEFCCKKLRKSFGDFYNLSCRGADIDFDSLYEEYKKLIPTGIFLKDKE